jgi:hypothetical protein
MACADPGPWPHYWLRWDKIRSPEEGRQQPLAVSEPGVSRTPLLRRPLYGSFTEGGFAITFRPSWVYRRRTTGDLYLLGRYHSRHLL